MSNNLVLEKSFAFAVRIVDMYKYLSSCKNEYVMSKQLLRSGTSIGANIKEAVNAQSKKEFIAKMNIALKEANESEYWIELLQRTEYITTQQGESILVDCIELCKLLSAIIKTMNEKH